MDQTLCRLIRAVLVLGIVAACGKVALAAPGDKYCPPLCTLPPDPAPPMPPINYPDPPFNPVAPSNPNNNGKGATATAAPAAATHATVVGQAREGAVCKSGNVSGTLVLSNGPSKFVCNFMPSTLKVGGACNANNQIGKVTVVDGKRYCKIAP